MIAIVLMLLAQPQMNAQAVRSLRLADGGTGFSTVVQGHVETTPTIYGKTAFGQARVAEPYTLADLTMTTGFDREVWGVSLDGGGTATWLPTEAAVLLRVVDGGIATTRTHDRYRYQAGKGQLVLQTYACQQGLCRWGYMDDEDGLYWEANDGGLSFVRRSSTDGGVHETRWPIDAGPGFDARMGSIYEQRWQWLGVGSVEAFVNGRHVLQIDHAGTLPGVYMATATLPLTYEVRAPANGSASGKQICASVQSEGGALPTATSFEVNRAADISVGAAAVDVPIISLRPAYLFNGIDNHVQVIPSAVWCVSDSKRLRVRFVLNPATMTGAVFGAASAIAATEFDTTATAITGGTSIGSFPVQANSSYEQNMNYIFGELRRKLRKRAFPAAAVGAGLDPSLDTFVVVANNPGAGTATVNCGIEYAEVR